MVATALQILHQQDFIAEKQFEVIVGMDNIARVNIDGICAIRVRLTSDCEIVLDADTSEESIFRKTNDEIIGGS